MAELEIDVVDMHTAGEPVRIVTGGYPALKGATILERRREARDNHDGLRRALMLEPRGHAGMYGVILSEPCDPSAVASVLFTHNEGYSTMCGHATIALGRFLVDRGYVVAAEPETRFCIEAPCGLLQLTVAVSGAVRFESVPAFVDRRDLTVAVPGHGEVVLDIAYGGAFYAILPASRLGLDLLLDEVEHLVAAGGAVTDAIRASVPIRHPTEPDLGFLYGTILTDDASPDADSCNLCIFAERQIDRSPTGSGVTARMALDHAKGLIREGVERRFIGISGGAFTGRVTETLPGEPASVRVEVGGLGHYTGTARFVLEEGDALREGFSLPRRFGERLARA